MDKHRPLGTKDSQGKLLNFDKSVKGPPISVIKQELARITEVYDLQGVILIFHTGKIAQVVYSGLNVYERLAALIVALHEAETARQLGLEEG